jgi:acyl carrier protein
MQKMATTPRGVSGGPNMISIAGSSAHDTFAIVQRLIAEVTGNELDDITIDADLEEDLGINMMSEFPAIITKIRKEIPEVIIPTSSFVDCATVAELVELIDEERDL